MDEWKDVERALPDARRGDFYLADGRPLPCLTVEEKAANIWGVLRSSGCLVFVWMLGQIPAYGQVSPFQFDPVEYYAARFLAAALILGIGLVVYNLFVYRGRIGGPVSWGVLAAGVVVVPSISVLLGTLLVFERAERVDFCASCHLTMKSYVDDLQNPESKSLAALHFKNRYIPENQCYQCHTSYGMFGTVEAKSAGMIDVYKYYTRTFHLPLKMRTPYPNNDCLKCHAESAKWAGVHGDFKEALFAGDMKCMECHGAEHPAHILSR